MEYLENNYLQLHNNDIKDNFFYGKIKNNRVRIS